MTEIKSLTPEGEKGATEPLAEVGQERSRLPDLGRIKKSSDGAIRGLEIAIGTLAFVVSLPHEALKKVLNLVDAPLI
jgi:hypothetical protein